jgi:hypothetical protein
MTNIYSSPSPFYVDKEFVFLGMHSWDQALLNIYRVRKRVAHD